MKRCQNCSYENVDSMNFCLECGTPLQDSTTAPTTPRMVVNLSDNPTDSLQGATPTNFGESRETVFGNRGALPPDFGNFMNQTAAPPRPKSNKKLFLILGGVASLLLLLGVAGASIAYYNYTQRKTIVSVSPTPTASPTGTSNSKSPSPKPSGSASPSPSATVAPTPNASFTPPFEPTKKGSFTVNASDSWQLSDIDVVSSEQFRTSVQGSIDLSGIKASVTPAGVNDAKTKARRIYPEFPTGALLMRTRYADGKTSNTVSMTTNGANGSWQNFPNETGKLEFCINDNAPSNNGGQFIVIVTMTSVPKTKK